MDINFSDKFKKKKDIIYKSGNIIIDNYIQKLEIFLIKIKNNAEGLILTDINNLLNKFIEQIKNINCEIETKLILGYYCNKFNKYFKKINKQNIKNTELIAQIKITKFIEYYFNEIEKININPNTENINKLDLLINEILNLPNNTYKKIQLNTGLPGMTLLYK